MVSGSTSPSSKYGACRRWTSITSAGKGAPAVGVINGSDLGDDPDAGSVLPQGKGVSQTFTRALASSIVWGAGRGGTPGGDARQWASSLGGILLTTDGHTRNT